MPGYVIHLATLTESERTNRDFVKGVLAPDLLKKWYKISKGNLSQVEKNILNGQKIVIYHHFLHLKKDLFKKRFLMILLVCITV